MSVRIAAVALVGCGRIGFDAPPSEASIDASACTFGPWSAPIPIGELNTPDTEYGGQISPDGLTLYFDSNRFLDEDLFVAARPDRSSPFDVANELITITTNDDDADPTISHDGLEIIFFRSTGIGCLYDARRPSTTVPFDPATATTICNAGGAFLSRDGLTLYYNTRIDNQGEGVLYRTTRASTSDVFEPGAPIPELTGGATKGYPALTSDELAIVFESSGGGPDLDLWIATRTTTADPFGTPDRIPELETTSNDGDASFTDDGTEIFFESDQPGSPDLYHATRACL